MRLISTIVVDNTHEHINSHDLLHLLLEQRGGSGADLSFVTGITGSCRGLPFGLLVSGGLSGGSQSLLNVESTKPKGMHTLSGVNRDR